MTQTLEIIIEEPIETDVIVFHVDDFEKKPLETISEDVIIEPLPTWQYAIMYFGVFTLFVSLCIYTVFNFDNTNSLDIFMKKVFIYVSIVFLSWANGKFLRNKLQWKVNYTRKVNHVCVWLIPFIADFLINVDDTFISQLWNIFMGVVSQTLWLLPTRNFDKTGILIS